MIVFPRERARSVRALARKCVAGRPRGPAPPVVFESRAGTLSVWVHTADAVLTHTAPTAGGDGVLVVPMDVLTAVEGTGDEAVELVVGEGLRGEARWSARGVSHTHPFDRIEPGKPHRPPPPPDDWHPVPPAFLTALHECGRTAGREAGRFALTRVQVAGSAGRVAGTDGRTALIWDGFALPFDEDLLVPAVPVFGDQTLAAGPAVRVGRTADHLVVEVGPWRVFLTADATGRYPDVAGAVPKHAPTVVTLDSADAAALLAAWPRLPGADVACHPVTLAVDGGVVVRGRDEATGAVETVRLARPAVTGPTARIAVDRQVLARALALGCTTVRVADGRPVVFAGGGRTVVTMALDPDPAAEVEPATTGIAAADLVRIPEPVPERRIAVRPASNGHAAPDPPPTDPVDPVVVAEDLRAALADAAAKAGRLVAALKSRRKEQKALTQVWSSLKALHLGPGGSP
ncbi:hypothetical protein [Fimbriiglobus ruber]|uniref:DNA polymerase III beta subunit n=1 Tax=Fimbriiglobus ruber TaxID=1908690 RepID=A0A225DN21_9BACT|nr:hypothetical protein [Fimbriiglobus ruber]OWK39988.1 hypothetical protein FRUB_05878 [Fimbriiglobus ruber]